MLKRICIPVALMCGLTGCGEEILDWRNAQISGGKVYANGANEPFSGTLTNMPGESLPDSKSLTRFQNDHNAAMGQIKGAWIDGRGISKQGVVCDTHVQKGFVVGDTACRSASSGALRYKFTFKDGELDGAAESFDRTGSLSISRALFKDGTIEGSFEAYSPNTGVLITKYNYSNGQLEGVQNQFDEKSGKKTQEVIVTDGKFVGVAREWDIEGRPTKEVPYKNGLRNGEAKTWADGKLFLVETYVMGKQQGRRTEYEADGSIYRDEMINADGTWTSLKHDEVVQDDDAVGDDWDTAVSPANQTCVDEWTRYAQKIEGPDVMIGIESLKDWNSMCGEGQHPPA